MESREIGVGGLEHVLITVLAFDHPFFQSIVGHVSEHVEVGCLLIPKVRMGWNIPQAHLLQYSTSVSEFAGRRRPIFLEHFVVFSCMSACKSDVTVVEGGVWKEYLSADSGITNGIGSDG